MVALQTKPVLKYVAIGLNASDPLNAIQLLSKGLEREEERQKEFLDAAQIREQQASTYIGYETALPHARMSSDFTWQIAFGRFSEGVRWNHEDEIVRLVFLSLVPSNIPAAYLGFIRTIGLALRDSATRNQLLTAQDEREIRSWLSQHLDLH